MSDVKARIALGEGAMHSLRKIWKSKFVAKRTKLRLGTSMVFSVALQGAEITAYTKEMRAKIESFHLRVIRRIVGKKKEAGVAQEEKKESTAKLLSKWGELPLWEGRLRTRRLLWLQHQIRQAYKFAEKDNGNKLCDDDARVMEAIELAREEKTLWWTHVAEDLEAIGETWEKFKSDAQRGSARWVSNVV